jgi:phosphatidylserine/phosphatidylglycerophosphate/cardiolipin synthase-like enzyme
VFTRWSHDPTTGFPRITPVYVHAKVGIVDDVWATVGSANLDSLSLDTMGLAELFHLRAGRSTEVNVVIVDGVDGQPSTVANLLRRRLWSEHLGFESAGEPNPNHRDLGAPPSGGWLNLWTQRADANLKLLKTNPATRPPDTVGNILPFPDVDTTLTEPAEHLENLGIDMWKLHAISEVPGFSFVKGKWKSSATVDWPASRNDPTLDR